jgi:hypothetical protein
MPKWQEISAFYCNSKGIKVDKNEKLRVILETHEQQDFIADLIL